MGQAIKLGSDTFLHITGLYGLVSEEMPSTANWDNYRGYIYNKIYYVGDASGMTNAPASWGFLICLSWGGIHSQIFTSFNGGRIYIRGYSGSSWQAWKYVQLS